PNNFNSNIDNVLSLGVIDFIQAPYNPLETWAEEFVYSSCIRNGVYILARSLFKGGVITNKLISKVESSSSKRTSSDETINDMSEKINIWVRNNNPKSKNLQQSIILHV